MKTLTDYFLSRNNTLNNTQSMAALIYRIYAALLIVPFGWGKLQDYDALSKDFFGNVIGIGDEFSLILALIVQLGCPLFLIFGFQSRFFSVILALHMIVATKYHFYDPYGNFCYPLAYFGMYCILAVLGPGRYSVDYRLFAEGRTPLEKFEKMAIIVIAVSMVLGWTVFYCQFAAWASVLLIVLILCMWACGFYLVNRK